MPTKQIAILTLIIIFSLNSSLHAQMKTRNEDGSYNRYAYKEWSQSQTNKKFQETSSKALSKTDVNTVAGTRKSSNNPSELKQSAADKAKNNSCISGDCVNGFGTLQGTPDLLYKYVGGFKNGEFDGKGKEIDYEGYVRFEGVYANGMKLSGRQVTYKEQRVFGDETVKYYNEYLSSIYEGSFKEFWRDGKGTLDEYNKQGRLTGSYEGNFKKDSREGHGTLILYSFDTMNGFYVGEWEADLRHGKGVDSVDWRGTYVGDFKNGERDGEGVSYWENSKVKEMTLKYVGTWLKGFRDGFGTDYDKTGNMIYEGNFSKDKRHGAGKIFKADGTTAEGIWVNGINNEIDPTAEVKGSTLLREINENFDNNNVNGWSDYSFQKLEKGSYTVSSAGKIVDNTEVLVPGGISFSKNDDWSYEVSMKKMSGRDALSYGIGWAGGGEFMISNDDLVSFHYGHPRSRIGISDEKCRVKKGSNTLMVIKKGNSITAMVNGKAVYTGIAENLESKGLYLLLIGSSSREFKVKFTSVVFKRL